MQHTLHMYEVLAASQIRKRRVPASVEMASCTNTLQAWHMSTQHHTPIDFLPPRRSTCSGASRRGVDQPAPVLRSAAAASAALSLLLFLGDVEHILPSCRRSTCSGAYRRGSGPTCSSLSPSRGCRWPTWRRRSEGLAAPPAPWTSTSATTWTPVWNKALHVQCVMRFP